MEINAIAYIKVFLHRSLAIALYSSILISTSCAVMLDPPITPYDFDEWVYNDVACAEQVNTEIESRISVDEKTEKRFREKIKNGNINFAFIEGQTSRIKVRELNFYNSLGENTLVELAQYFSTDTYFFALIDKNGALLENYACATSR